MFDKHEAAFRIAFSKAIKELGIEALKQTSLFGSNKVSAEVVRLPSRDNFQREVDVAA